jgi:hypothetical protein
VTQPVGPDRRLFNMMQHPLYLAAKGEQSDPPEPRGVVTNDDARDAILQLAAVIDEAMEVGNIPPERAIHAGAMLMLVRDYIKPLPGVPGPDGKDRVTPDLEDQLRVLRRVGGESGVHG